jgi:hypothetical protein
MSIVMNPFKKSHTTKLEDSIAALAKRGEQLAAKRIVAQKTLDAAIKVRQQGLLAGDLDDDRALDKARANVDSATSDLVGIDDAINLLAQAEAQLTAERDQVERHAAAEKLAEQVAAIEAKLPAWLAASASSRKR